MKAILIFCVCSFSGVAAQLVIGQVENDSQKYDPNEWGRFALKLSNPATLRDFFDSGIRPYRHPGLELSTLEAKHLTLTIELSSGKVLPAIPVQVINIKPFADGEIAHFDGFTQKLTLEEARSQMAKWLPYASSGLTLNDLEAYLRKVESDYLDFDDPFRGDASGCAVGWQEEGYRTKGGGPACSVWFRKSTSKTHPLMLYFKFSWGLNRPLKDANYYRVPIPPPPGYEGVSMNSPDGFGPDSAIAINRARGVDVSENPVSDSFEALVEPASTLPSVGRSNVYVLIFWITLGLVLGLILYLIAKRTRERGNGTSRFQ